MGYLQVINGFQAIQGVIIDLMMACHAARTARIITEFELNTPRSDQEAFLTWVSGAPRACMQR